MIGGRTNRMPHCGQYILVSFFIAQWAIMICQRRRGSLPDWRYLLVSDVRRLSMEPYCSPNACGLVAELCTFSHAISKSRAACQRSSSEPVDWPKIARNAELKVKYA